MSWILGSALAAGALASWFGKRSGSALSLSDSFSDNDMSSHHSMFDDDSLSSTSAFSDSIFDSSPSINPANGLPMLGCIDIEGNAYGTDTSHDYSISSNSMFDDSFSSFSNSSLCDDSFMCTSSIDSTSLFD